MIFETSYAKLNMEVIVLSSENSISCFEIINVFHLTERPARTSSLNANRSRNSIAYRISGHSQFQSMGKSYFADTGSIIYIPAGVDYVRTSTVENLIIVNLNVHGENEKEICVYPPDKAQPFSKYFFELDRVWNSHVPGCNYKCTSILYNMLYEIINHQQIHNTNKKEEIIKKSLIYMKMYFDNPQITIDEIAKQSHISPVYFRKLFGELFGISPSKAISDMRIQKAKDFLASGYFNVYEVAEKCGFENEKYFSTLFKKVTGSSPTQYKASAKSTNKLQLKQEAE